MLKINFCDMHRGFDPYNNFIVDIIHRRIGEWEISEEPDVLFIGCSGTKHYSYSNCVKIMVVGEALAANFNVCDYAIAFPYMQYEDRYLKRPAWFTHEPPVRSEVDYTDNHLYGIEKGIQGMLTDEQLLNRKFCNFVYSNSSRGTAVQFRQDFAKKLMEYKHIDCPGRVLNNMPSGSISPREGEERPGKIEFVKDYKFTIAFENCQMPGYSTEKIEDPFIAHSIPIYWGDPRVYEMYNECAFICANGRDLDDVIKQVIYLDNHDDEYLDMLKTYPVVGSYENDKKEIEEFIVRAIITGKDIFIRDPLEFGRVMTVPDYRTKELLAMLGQKVVNKFR